MSTGTNPFAGAEAWDPTSGGGEFLPEGDFVVTIDSVEDATANSSGNPKAVFDMSNEQGTTKYFCPYSTTFLDKIVGVFDAAGVARPQEGEFNPNDRCRIRLDVLQRLVGCRVGVAIRPEADQNDPTKMWNRVKGCVPPSRIDGGPDTRGLPAPVAPGQQAAGAAAPAAPGHSAIPF